MPELRKALRTVSLPGGSGRCGNGAELVEAAFQVLDQVLRVFEADVEAQGRTFRLPARRGAAAYWIGRQDQALITTPARPDPEQIERIDHCVYRRFGGWFEDDDEQPAGPEKIALPQFVAWIVGQSGVEHTRDLGPGLQPTRHGKRILLVP